MKYVAIEITKLSSHNNKFHPFQADRIIDIVY